MAIDKAVDSANLNAGLTTIANAIRAKGGTSAQLSFPTGMKNAVDALPATKYATGTSRTNAQGSCNINCGFDPDIVLIEGSSYTTQDAYGQYTFYPAIMMPMYRLNTASSSVKTDAIVWSEGFSWASSHDVILGCSAYRIQNGASLYLYSMTDSLEYVPHPNTTFTWKAYKFM